MKKFQKWIDKANVLLEVLPYIKEFSGTTMVIKTVIAFSDNYQ